MMLPRVQAKAVEVLNTGVALSKYDLAQVAPCDQRTAQRVLQNLHSMRQVRIIGWQKVYHQRIPIYHMSEGTDYPKPAAMTHAEQQRKFRIKKGWKE